MCVCSRLPRSRLHRLSQPSACAQPLLVHRCRAQAMSTVDDDATITQLATAWLGVAVGGAKIKEAQYIYQEMGDKFNFTVRQGSSDRCCCGGGSS